MACIIFLLCVSLVALESRFESVIAFSSMICFFFPHKFMGISLADSNTNDKTTLNLKQPLPTDFIEEHRRCCQIFAQVHISQVIPYKVEKFQRIHQVFS